MNVSQILQFHAGNASAIWLWTTLVFALSIVPIAALRRHDQRALDGVNVWMKPLKFALALAMHFATFFIIVICLPNQSGDSYAMTVTASVSAFAGIAELGYIALQAGRHRNSHFNLATPWEALAYRLMGLGSIALISPAILIGVVLCTQPPPWPSAVIAGTAASLFLGFGLTLLTGLSMGARMSHFNDQQGNSQRTMWLTGWSLDRADLRPAHFLGTHTIQVVPLAAIMASRLLPPGTALVACLGLALAWSALTLGILLATLRGKSLMQMVPLPLWRTDNRP
ncbi:hypothetical protein RGU70_14985 [Herbaspirillum sp. RTI4]|uniref:hypothetical protein n=1 Tax=Herbaspirillum sp. RTI4 TaxID=3048640 RepID=UPI002AB4D6AC|nr:hypothetical protein [Herbaspirillum sp. RTI4]MDY7579619.1 hypothetical protein [Herbaspirillum sp. RTI4]MEA9981834.1 hypothetical protein [Herbaspirillum sp. RTI4]